MTISDSPNPGTNPLTLVGKPKIDLITVRWARYARDGGEVAMVEEAMKIMSHGSGQYRDLSDAVGEFSPSNTFGSPMMFMLVFAGERYACFVPDCMTEDELAAFEEGTKREAIVVMKFRAMNIAGKWFYEKVRRATPDSETESGNRSVP